MNFIFSKKAVAAIGVFFVFTTPVFAQTSGTLWYDDDESSSTYWYDDYGYGSDTYWYDDDYYYGSDTYWYDDYGSDTYWYDDYGYGSDTYWYDDDYYVDDYYYTDSYYNDYYYGGGYYGGGGYYYRDYDDDDYPVCEEFTTSPSYLSAPGTVTLRWETDDADTVSISGVGSVSKDGSRSVNVNSSRTFTLTARGDGHQVSCNVYVEVERRAVEQRPICDAFYATPSRVEEGEEFRLVWNTSYGSSVNINRGIGNVSGDGSRYLIADDTETYTLTVSSNGETVDCQTTITVDEQDAPHPQCNAFYATPTVLSNDGNTTLNWNTTHASSVNISGGVGTVSQNGSRSVYVNNSQTFTLTAQNSEGDTINCTTSVTVLNDTPTNHNDLSCDSFYASPSHVEEDEEFRLYWQTTDADEVYINNGIGYVNRSGSEYLETDNDEHYILTARNGSDEVTCHAYVTIDDDDEDRPRCDLEVSDNRVDRGDRVRISWDNRYAEYIRLRDDNGEEYFDTRHSSSDRREFDEDDGSIYVYPDEDTEYALTVYNDEGTRTCRVDVDVDGSVASASISRTQQPLVAGIALSNVPYTGFEAGPLLTSIFYTILALWGIGIAYLLVVRKKPVVAMSTPTVASMTEAPVVPVAVAPTPEPIVTSEITQEERRSPLRARAEEERILLAPDALAFIKEQAGTEEEQLYLFNKLNELAKAAFPMEDGWIALDKSRIESIIADA